MQEEFERLYGASIDPELYRRLECIYVDSSEDKPAFVKRVKKEHLDMREAMAMVTELRGEFRTLEQEYLEIKQRAESDIASPEIRDAFLSAWRRNTARERDRADLVGYNTYVVATKTVELIDQFLKEG